jgi:peptidoglycan/xylan/chitin deacetylase (PgdA/CDA1 family)
MLDEASEREHIARAHESIARTVGRPPKGWYCRYAPSERTRALLVEHGGYLYDSDAYNDDLPYWTEVHGAPHLVVPYSMVTNDAKFASGDVYAAADYAAYLTDTFDVLLAESVAKPRIMSVGLHSRIMGHPGRLAGLIRFLDHVERASGVWVCGRDSIAEHWQKTVPA